MAKATKATKANPAEQLERKAWGLVAATGEENTARAVGALQEAARLFAAWEAERAKVTAPAAPAANVVKQAPAKQTQGRAYRFLRAYQLSIGSPAAWVEQLLARAERERAPASAVFRHGVRREWVTFEQLPPNTQAKLSAIVAKLA